MPLRVPKIFNLRRDPFERADENSNTYWDWVIDHAFLMVPAQAYVAQQIKSLMEFPPRQKPASFNLDRVLEQLQMLPAAACTEPFRSCFTHKPCKPRPAYPAGPSIHHAAV